MWMCKYVYMLLWYICVYEPICVCIYMLSLSLSLSLTHTHTNTNTQTHTCTHFDTFHILEHTLTNTHMHTQSDIHTLTHSLNTHTNRNRHTHTHTDTHSSHCAHQFWPYLQCLICTFFFKKKVSVIKNYFLCKIIFSKKSIF